MSEQLFDTAPFHDPEAAKALLAVFEVEDGGETVHVITDTPEKALKVAKETIFCDVDEEFDSTITVKELPMDKVLSIWMENGRISDGGELVPKTCAEWITRQGEGFLCTSEF